jgi:hypothetical protein
LIKTFEAPVGKSTTASRVTVAASGCATTATMADFVSISPAKAESARADASRQGAAAEKNVMKRMKAP